MMIRERKRKMNESKHTISICRRSKSAARVGHQNNDEVCTGAGALVYVFGHDVLSMNCSVGVSM